MNDGQCLKKVLGTRFKEVELHSTPQPLFGFQGDYRTEDGAGHTKDANKALKAEIIVRRQFVGGVSNDLGFRKNDQTGNYDAIISAYDSSKHNDRWLEQLSKDYLVEKAKSLMSEQEAELIGVPEPLADGGIRLRFRPSVYA
jgi:hypothetical protein